VIASSSGRFSPCLCVGLLCEQRRQPRNYCAFSPLGRLIIAPHSADMTLSARNDGSHDVPEGSPTQTIAVLV
jgi:hypothetical protein